MAESGGTRSVFISYASQDVGAAQRICDALRAAGIEVWLDQRELRGGDAWDAGIRNQIRACALFIPVISRNTSARDEGYFRLEWKLAVDRSHLMASDRAFIVPVVIDSTRESEARVPERFTDLQWTRLPGGEATADFAKRIVRLLASEARSDTDGPPARQQGANGANAHWQRPVVAFVLGAAALGGVAAVLIARHSFGTSAPVGAAEIAATTPVPGPRTASSTGIPVKSIAVLPFVNMSDDPKQEYFSDGLAEELLDLLSRVPELQVAARTSAFSFRGKSDDIPTIARKLMVANVLEGSVRKSGKRLRITVQLVRADNGYQLWSQTYDRKLDDIFKIQDEIASAVVKGLKVSLLGDAVPKAKGTENIEAYTLYLQGRAIFLRAGTVADFEKVADYMQQALKLDPKFAPAWVWLSAVRGIQAGWVIPSQRGYEEARRAAGRAQALDPNLSSAHSMMALIHLRYDWDWAGTQAELRKALELDPNNTYAWLWSGRLSQVTGHYDEALEFYQRAVATDPLNALVYEYIGNSNYMMGHLAEALAAFRKAADLDPGKGVWGGSIGTGLVKLASGEPTSALAEFERAKDKDDRQYGLALAYHALERKAEADLTLAEYEKEFTEQSAYRIAEIYAYRGEIDRAFAWLDRAYRQRDDGLSVVRGDPLLENLRSDTRFTVFLRKMKLLE